MPPLAQTQAPYTSAKAKEDLDLLDKVAAQQSATRDVHVTIQQAVMRLELFIAKHPDPEPDVVEEPKPQAKSAKKK